MPISAKFPYRVAELVGKFNSSELVNEELSKIALAEFQWILQQQTRKADTINSDEALAQLREELLAKASAYLQHLQHFSWKCPTSDGKEYSKEAPRPLREFIHLFALEAFIARTGD
jgi:hypothetical protein